MIQLVFNCQLFNYPSLLLKVAIFWLNNCWWFWCWWLWSMVRMLAWPRRPFAAIAEIGCARKCLDTATSSLAAGSGEQQWELELLEERLSRRELLLIEVARLVSFCFLARGSPVQTWPVATGRKKNSITNCFCTELKWGFSFETAFLRAILNESQTGWLLLIIYWATCFDDTMKVIMYNITASLHVYNFKLLYCVIFTV